MPTELNLLPIPRRIDLLEGHVAPDTPVSESIDASVARPQGYRLTVEPIKIVLTGHDEAGLFYARQTLVQLRRAYPKQLPSLQIEDWPDFPARGVMLDISRDKVPTMATLFQLVDELSEWKINQIQLYTEHTFAYSKHQEVWRDASPMTAAEIKKLDAYCRERFIELVPNQNSFGHMDRWLKHETYRHLAEKETEGWEGWGIQIPGWNSVDPRNPKSIELFSGLYDELLPNFSSKLFNIGCDETLDLGQGKSKEECERRGKERVYLDFLLKLHKLISARGRTMQFWGDIIMHRPELIPELPKDVIALEWGYEANHPFDKDASLFAASGVPFYVCPGTSAWATIAGRTDNAIANLKSAAENGLKHGAIGYLNTDWGDGGHWQHLPVSYLGLSLGAAYSWCYESNRDVNVIDLLNVHVFRDSAGVMGKVAYDLGNVYQLTGVLLANTSLLHRLMTEPVWMPPGVTREGLLAAERGIDAAIAPLDRAQMDRPDAQQIKDEFRVAARLMKHASARGLWKVEESPSKRPELSAELRGIMEEQSRLWLVRNRPGGLRDSLAKLERIAASYTA